MPLTKISKAFREKRFKLFLSTFDIHNETTILDIGGYPYFWEGSGLEKNVTLLNIQPLPGHIKSMKWIKANALEMDMVGDRQFDIAFSNSVIEHVGDFSQQKRLSCEIRRISRQYWIQTPNRHFPIEPHFLFPFFQYLPVSIKHKIAHFWPFSFAKRYNLDVERELNHIWPLDKRHFQELFDTAEILEERFMGLTKSLIAVKT